MSSGTLILAHLNSGRFFPGRCAQIWLNFAEVPAGYLLWCQCTAELHVLNDEITCQRCTLIDKRICQCRWKCQRDNTECFCVTIIIVHDMHIIDSLAIGWAHSVGTCGTGRWPSSRQQPPAGTTERTVCCHWLIDKKTKFIVVLKIPV